MSLKSLALSLLEWAAPTDWLDTYARKRWQRPQGFDGLTLVYADEFGRQWYEYPAGHTLPLARRAVQMDAVSYLTVSLSPKMMDEAKADIDKALAKCDMVAVLATVTRFFDTREHVVPMDNLINLIAITLVRSDEAPDNFDSVTHADKCDYLKAQMLKGDGFFFHLTEVKELSRKFSVTAEHWGQLWTRFEEVSRLRQKERDLILQRLSANE